MQGELIGLLKNTKNTKVLKLHFLHEKTKFGCHTGKMAE